MRPSAALLLAATLGLAACGDREEAAQPSMAASPLAVAELQTGEFDAAGTEPFWALKVRADSLALSRAGQPDVTAPAAKPEALGETLVWRTPTMNVSIMTRECNNGMSDQVFPYTAEVRIGEEVLSGCATRPGQTKPS